MSLLGVEGLSVYVATERGPARVVRDVSFTLAAGETLGIVGESGSGKSMTALALMGLLPRSAAARGRVTFEGTELLGSPDETLCHIRGNRIGMIFQEPMTSLNPVHRIGDQVAEPLVLHRGTERAAALAEAARLLDRVGIPNARARLGQYPHEMSGGQRQRVMIAMALACEPALLIADEPTSALDVTVQVQLIALLRELIAERGMALITISHDLGVIGRLAERTLVFYGGAVMEDAPTAALVRRSIHPYTQGLFAALPSRSRGKGTRLTAIRGTVPAAPDLPPGCPFFGRCPRGDERCRVEKPPAAVEDETTAYCFHPGVAA